MFVFLYSFHKAICTSLKAKTIRLIRGKTFLEVVYYLITEDVEHLEVTVTIALCYSAEILVIWILWWVHFWWNLYLEDQHLGQRWGFLFLVFNNGEFLNLRQTHRSNIYQSENLRKEHTCAAQLKVLKCNITHYIISYSICKSSYLLNIMVINILL